MPEITFPEEMWSDHQEEDPFVLYLVVNKDLKMSGGKIAAQVGHAVQYVVSYGYYCYLEDGCIGLNKGYQQAIELWMSDIHGKIVLSADTKIFNKIKEELPVFVVRDAGRTEIEPGSETVLALVPMRKSQAPKIIQQLQLLK